MSATKRPRRSASLKAAVVEEEVTKLPAPADDAAAVPSTSSKRRSSSSSSSSKKPSSSTAAAGQPPLLIPELESRILVRGSERLTASLRADFYLPDYVLDWHAKQRERNAGRVTGTRSLERAMSEFKQIKCNDYSTALGFADDRGDQSMDDYCLCTGGTSDVCDFKCLNRSLQIECTPETCRIYARGVDCGNQRMWRALKKQIEPRLVEGKGIGMFALEFIAPAQYVNEYVGEVISERECMRRLAHDYAEEKHKYLMNMSGGLIIDATRKGNVSRFINHSCDPNCRIQEWKVRGERRMGLFSVRAIDVGEELSFNYNFQRFGEEHQSCHCGAANCVGLLGRGEGGDGSSGGGASSAGGVSAGGSNGEGGGSGGGGGGGTNLVSLFPRNFFVQRDPARKVENFLLELLEWGVPKQDEQYAREQGIFLVRNVRQALREEYMDPPH